MPNQEVRLDAVFRALSDPTRRAVVERLCNGPATTSELAQPFGMRLPSFSQHLEVLERCGLVRLPEVGPRADSIGWRRDALQGCGALDGDGNAPCGTVGWTGWTTSSMTLKEQQR